jgi:four helix bundle protein
MENNVVLEKAIAFALRIIKLYRYLVEQKKEFVLSKELLVAGTNIGKHINEAVNAESKEIFVTGFDIARRRSADTDYWLLLLHSGGFISGKEFESINADRIEVTKLINSIRAKSRKHG